MKLLRKILVAAGVLAALLPAPVLACATCHGKSDSPLAHGMNAGIFTLMGVIGGVLACITLFFVHIIRAEKAHNGSDSHPDTTPHQAPPTP